MFPKLIMAMALITYPLIGADGANVIGVDKDNVEMNNAIALAKTTFTEFEKNWKTMKSDGYSIKVVMKTKDNDIEHIWFSPIEITDENIKAKCANEPNNIVGLKLGDIRNIKRDDISDWMIIVGKKCYGGYTIRAIVKQNPSKAPPFEFVDFK